MRPPCFSRAISLQGQARGEISVSRFLDARRSARRRWKRRSRPTSRSRRNSISGWCRSRAHGGELALGGDGEAVEWALKMRRFDESQTLDHLADAGRIDVGSGAALARVVAAAHARAPVVDAAPWIAALERLLSSRTTQRFANIPTCFPPMSRAALTASQRRRACALRPLLRGARRARAGPARPRRSASRQYRADRRRAGAVRRAGIRSGRWRPAICSTISPSC